ncbi:MAG: SIR2 family protein [Myxococcales bacterium]|nr:SIR2 family protein [Myxococcales bacterium]
MAVSWTSDDRSKRGLSWAELVDQAARLLGVEPELLRFRGDSLRILEYFSIKKAGVAPLINWQMREMHAPDAALASSVVHTALCGLRHCRTIYTTNYDDYIERSFTLAGEAVQKVAIEADMGAHGHQREVVKFHGDFDHPTTLVVTESDYNRRLAFESPMDFRLRADLLGRAILFIGYSFNDANVAYLFHKVKELLHGLPGTPSGRRAYIVLPNPSDFEIQLFRVRNIEVLPIDGIDLTAETARLLEEIAA